jgi:hypothetical protein
MNKRQLRPVVQPTPRNRGLTREMIREHARILFRDIFSKRPLSSQQWRIVEEDLVRKLEQDGF